MKSTAKTRLKLSAARQAWLNACLLNSNSPSPKKLIVQSWHWFQKKSKDHKKLIESALSDFETFQLDWRS